LLGFDYHSIVWRKVVRTGVLVLGIACRYGNAQDLPLDKQAPPQSEPHYADTFSGPIIELSAERITVSRSVLGKPAEKKSFWIKPDTRVEGKLHVRVKVTVGFDTTDEGDIARLIVVRQDKKK
jgi:hypothetical protein